MGVALLAWGRLFGPHRERVAVPNASSTGQSYLCFSRTGLDLASVRPPRHTTQTIFGAADLDTLPATNAEAGTARIWMEQGSKIALKSRSQQHVSRWLAQGDRHRCTGAQRGRGRVQRRSYQREATAIAGGEHHVHVAGRQLPAHRAAFFRSTLPTLPHKSFERVSCRCICSGRPPTA